MFYVHCFAVFRSGWFSFSSGWVDCMFLLVDKLLLCSCYSVQLVEFGSLVLILGGWLLRCFEHVVIQFLGCFE